MNSLSDTRLAKKMERKRNLKRKILGNSPDHRPSKRQKVAKKHLALDELAWKVVERPSAAGIDEEGGMLMLEEVDDVEVYYEETENGKIAKFRQIEKPDKKNAEVSDSPVNNLPPTLSEEDEKFALISDDETSPNFLPEWQNFGLKSNILQRLHGQGFTSPTPIQQKTLPLSLSGRDVIGISQTGSGKTLAFGLPILQYILSRPRPLKEEKRSLAALVIAPTRELALQVSEHITRIAPPRTAEQIRKHAPPRVSVVTVVGGMSSQKQTRQLERGVDIIVATPGRLWELLSEDDLVAEQVKGIKFFVLDEADRMIENGHFAELEKIIRLVSREENESVEDQVEAVKLEDTDPPQYKMQTFIFSATMSKDLQRNLKRRRQPKANLALGATIDELIMRLDFRDPTPEVVDLSPKDSLVSTFQESKIECLPSDKDIYLYYFLLRYPGRSLVFMSAIDGIRRLTPILDHLKVKVWPLHSQMEQRQRLKNLDRFKNTSKCVLLATDVAARGLDIPLVDHVVHYQVPRSADAYVHRNGRTARAERPGFGLLLCGPDEKVLLRSLFWNLKRKDEEVPDLLVERDLLDKLKARVELAREIDKIQHKITKDNYENNWLKTTAEAMEIELSDDEIPGGKQDQNAKVQNSKAKVLKKRLQDLLAQPLMARGVSAKFITSGARPVVDDLIRGQTHESMLGLEVVAAQDHIAEQRQKTKGKRIIISK